jgi:hypothetical protein
MEVITREYSKRSKEPSDIFEHLPTLRTYASKCESVLEMGVRGCVSSWAMALGLLENGKAQKKLLLNDIDVCDTAALEQAARKTPLQIRTIWMNNLKVTLEEDVDLTFIDTWHVYGQLKRELALYAPRTRKYILMHDTTVDEWEGETIRMAMNAEEQSRVSGFPLAEIRKGLWPAVEEFLAANQDWELHQRFTNNNGLTVLKRRGI